MPRVGMVRFQFRKQIIKSLRIQTEKDEAETDPNHKPLNQTSTQKSIIIHKWGKEEDEPEIDDEHEIDSVEILEK